MRLEPADDPERQVRAAKAAAQFTIERASRYVEQRIVVPDPIVFIRATRDALSAWLEQRADEIGGPTTQTPVGWPWETWPT
jgi:hypothetical protein